MYVYFVAMLPTSQHVCTPTPSPKTSLRAGGTHLSVLARGLASYLHVSLDTKEVERIGRVLSQQTTRWIVDMMKWVLVQSGNVHVGTGVVW